MEFEDGYTATCCGARPGDDTVAYFRYTRAMEQVHDTSTNPVSAAPPAHDDDALRRDLIARIADGDENALGRLYDDTAGRVYALALRIVRNAQDAEEVALDVYTQVWRNAERYDAARGRVLAWIMTMCRSRALDTLRRRETMETHPEPEMLRASDMIAGDDPQDWIELFERDGQVRRALNRLPQAQRDLLGLAFLRGLSHQEIADETRLPLGTVKSHIRKSLAALREMLPNPFTD